MRYDADMAPYGCTAGIATTTTWNSLLKNFKPTNDSVLVLLGAEFNLMASSNMLLVPSSSPTGVSFNVAVADEWTQAFQKLFVTRYSSQTGKALVDARRGFSFEASINGTEFIVGISVANVTQYDEDQMFLIAGIPRHQIYGKIESAKKQSTAVVIGISVAVTTFVAGVFVAVALPLLRLSQEMAQLTKLDFGTLETSGALDRRSLIWELRKVQITFATMVRAFAGAIKRNRAMVRGATGTGSQQTRPMSKTSAAVDTPQTASQTK
ncbi:hypothetical protein BDZ88DRAFT_435108 [Geranomyces variabilis]|nr:hypothetical protein BDZ88DRAFT_435108 [Geranomyces variabilis]